MLPGRAPGLFRPVQQPSRLSVRRPLHCMVNGADYAPASVNGLVTSSVVATDTEEEVYAAAGAPAPAPAQQQQQQPSSLSGKDVEARAMRLAVDMHERYLAGDRVAAPAAQSCSRFTGPQMESAYERCGYLTSEYAKTFYLGTQLMQPEKARAIWAIYVWCRRTDELVDGPNASRVTPAMLDRWEERLEEIFAGRPYDILDAALADTVQQFPLDIQSFRDMVEGMRMDLYKPRYRTFDELYEYCYRVAGTVGLMSTPIMGVDPSYKGELEPVYGAALALGTANQLTNILRDVGEDAEQRNRIYLPLEELEQYGLTEAGVLNFEYVSPDGKVDQRWKDFMKFQIERARECFAQAEVGVSNLDRSARWPVWSALILYRMILDRIEENDYDNFTKRAFVPKWQKLACLPAALSKAL